MRETTPCARETVASHHRIGRARATRGEDALLTIAESGIAPAGFTSIVIVFGQREGKWSAIDRFRTQAALQSSLGAAFFALVPSALSLLGLGDAPLWRSASWLFASYVGAGTFVSRRRASRLDEASLALMGTLIPRLFVGMSGLAMLLLLANSLGRAPDAGLYFSALMLQLLIAAIAFVRTVFIRPEPIE